MTQKSPIDEFLKTYAREYDFYDRLATLCHQQCEAALHRSGIRSRVTSRAKREDSLRKKLEHRHESNPYLSAQSIRDDIVDLAGVRIEIYFPRDRAIVDETLRRNFDIRECRTFPKESRDASNSAWSKRFSGYGATHYRLTLRPNETTGIERFCSTVIEVQVASVLMHAWAEVEHDLIYKPDSGIPSESEQAILDELNGLVIAGEIALERLQAAMRQRIELQTAPFRNHYELAAYLHSLIATRGSNQESLPMGRADILHEFLRRIQRLRPDDVTSMLQTWTADVTPNHGTLVEQAVNHILRLHPEWFRSYEDARQAVGEVNPYSDADIDSRATFERFLARYAELETTLSAIVHKHNVEDSIVPRYLAHLLEKLSNDTGQGVDDVKTATVLRNQIIHRGTRPDESVLGASTAALERALTALRDETSELFGRVRIAIEGYDAEIREAQHHIELTSLDEAVNEFKRQYTIEALNRFGGNRSQAARALGVDVRTIFRFLEKERSDGDGAR